MAHVFPDIAPGEHAGCVFGRVQLAGKVIEHERGYRAERARIAELIPTIEDRLIVWSLASRLDLPIGSSMAPDWLVKAIEELKPAAIVPPFPGPHRPQETEDPPAAACSKAGGTTDVAELAHPRPSG